MLTAFRTGRLRALLVTDLAARGLDVPECDAVRACARSLSLSLALALARFLSRSLSLSLSLSVCVCVCVGVRVCV